MRKHLFSIIYMFIVSFVFAAAVSAVMHISIERIRVNEKAKITGIILDVLGIERDINMDASELLVLFNQRVRTSMAGAKTLYISFSTKDSDRPGYAFEVSGPGFWGPIYGIAALDAEAEQILGVRFYKHNETPGLGARISERWFYSQFEELSLVRSDMDGKYIYLKRPGGADSAHDLEAVTGATMTSQAVEKLLNRELRSIIPEILKLNQRG